VRPAGGGPPPGVRDRPETCSHPCRRRRAYCTEHEADAAEHARFAEAAAGAEAPAQVLGQRLGIMLTLPLCHASRGLAAGPAPRPLATAALSWPNARPFEASNSTPPTPSSPRCTILMRSASST